MALVANSDTKHITYSGGRLFFRAAGTQGFRGLGDVPKVEITTKTETIDHFTSIEGVAKKNKSIVKKQEATGSLTVDEMSMDNVAMFILGDAPVATLQAAGTISDEPATALLNKWLKLAKFSISSLIVKSEGGANATITDIVETTVAGTYTDNQLTPDDDGSVSDTWTITFTGATAFTVSGTMSGALAAGNTTGDYEPNNPIKTKPYFKMDSTGWGGTWAEDDTITFTTTMKQITYVSGTDYKSIENAGWFQALDAGAITENQALKISYSYAVGTTTQSNAAQISTVEGDLQFVGHPATGHAFDVNGYCSIKPKGSLSLIGDKFMDLEFEFDFIENPNYEGLFVVSDRGTV